jgi:GNAT superfamily N-acetyltransferase
MALCGAAGWNQTPEDWRRILRLEPAGAFGIECDGRIATTATTLCYGRELAWIGMVLTHRDYQRRGFARQLMEASLDYAAARGVACVKLDATDMGRPLYASLGFVDEQPIERWVREPAPAISTMPAWTFDFELDREAFGCDRRPFIESLGCGFERAGTRARYFGPLVSRDATAAERVIRQAITSHDGAWFWDLLPAHPHAARIAASLGFTPVRKLMRMVRGADISTNDSLVYAIGGFEAG